MTLFFCISHSVRMYRIVECALHMQKVPVNCFFFLFFFRSPSENQKLYSFFFSFAPRHLAYKHFPLCARQIHMRIDAYTRRTYLAENEYTEIFYILPGKIVHSINCTRALFAEHCCRLFSSSPSFSFPLCFQSTFRCNV